MALPLARSERSFSAMPLVELVTNGENAIQSKLSSSGIPMPSLSTCVDDILGAMGLPRELLGGRDWSFVDILGLKTVVAEVVVVLL